MFGGPPRVSDGSSIVFVDSQVLASYESTLETTPGGFRFDVEHSREPRGGPEDLGKRGPSNDQHSGKIRVSQESLDKSVKR